MRSSCAQHAATLDNMRSLLSTGGLQKTEAHPDLPLLDTDMVRKIAELTLARNRNRDLHNTSRRVRAAMGTNTPYEFHVNANNEPEIQYPQKRDQILNFLEQESTRHSLTSITIRNFKVDPRSIAGEDPGAPRLAVVLRGCPRLHSLNLSGNQITGWNAIAQALAFCPLLATLDVSDCRIANHAETFAPCMYASTALTTLNLSGINLSRTKNLRCITDALPRCNRLQRLHLSNNSLSIEAAHLLVLALPQCHDLEHLDLCYNQFGDESGVALAQALVLCPKLQHLDFYSNNLDLESAENLAWALPQCTALRHLDLGNNKIGGLGVRSFGMNHVSHGLTYLDLSHNLIILPEHESLDGQMLSVDTLVHLILDGNPLGNNFTQALVLLLPTATHMTRLDLKKTSLTDAGVQALPQVIPQCPLLTHLSLTGNNRLTQETKTQIRNAWLETHGSMDGLQMDEDE